MKLYSQLPKCDNGKKHLFPFREGRGVELEVSDFLYGLVRLTKPTLVVETGTYVADSAVSIGKALRDNGVGHLHTCDTNPLPEARDRLHNLPVTIHESRGIDLLRHFPLMDFVFIDSGSPAVREEELMSLGEWNIPPLGIVAWHDACVSYENMYHAFAPQRNWPHLVFPSIIGVAVFQRPE